MKLDELLNLKEGSYTLKSKEYYYNLYVTLDRRCKCFLMVTRTDCCISIVFRRTRIESYIRMLDIFVPLTKTKVKEILSNLEIFK